MSWRYRCALVLLIGLLTDVRHVWASPSSDSLASIRSLIDQGHYADAELLARRSLYALSSASAVDSSRVADAMDLLVESLWRGGKFRDSTSFQLAEEAVHLREHIRAPDDASIASSLNNWGALLRNAGRPRDARPLYERALSIQEKALGPEHPDLAQTLNNLAIVFSILGDASRARPLYERALAIRQKALGPDHPGVAAILNGLANVLSSTGDQEGARAAYERALAIRERTLGPDHPDVATSLNNLAIFLGFTGDPVRAQTLFERALAIREKRLGPDHPDVAWSLEHLGGLLADLYEYTRALPMIERALVIREKTLGPEHPDVASTLRLQASVLTSAGDYTAARPLYERALKIQEKSLGSDRPEVATSLITLGNLLLRMGDYDGAIPLLERALKIRQAAMAPDDRWIAVAMDALANAYVDHRDFSRARTLYERAQVILEAKLGPDSPGLTGVLANLGGLCMDTGDYGTARRCFERTLAITRRARGEEHPQVALDMMNLAELLRVTGRVHSAIALADSALRIDERMLGAGHPTVAYDLQCVARIYSDSGESDSALVYGVRAEEIASRHLAITARGLPEREALDYAAARSHGLDIALSQVDSALANRPAAVSIVLDLLVRSRGLVFDEMSSRHRVLVSTRDTLLGRLLAARAVATQRLANLWARGPRGEDLLRYRATVDSALANADATERDLAERSLAFRGEHERAKARLEDVSAALPPHSALVSFVRYARCHVPFDTSAAHADPPNYLAFVLRAGEQAPTVTWLGPAAPIDSDVDHWRAAVERAPSLESEAACRRAGEQLRRKSWDPIAGHLAGIERVFVVPDGSLQLVNFSALPDDRGGYIVEQEPLLHVLSTERDLVTDVTRAGQGNGLLALGGVDYDHAAAPGSAGTTGLESASWRGPRSGCAVFADEHFRALPSTHAEIRDISSLWDGPRSGVVQLVGSAATEAAFKRLAPGKLVLHLATHGFCLGADCDSSDSASERESPLLRSGLVLAGANRRDRGPADADDGVLTAQEFGALDLEGMQWAVLSACETGVGALVAGEGVFGLRRAAQMAGAHTVIMSLWKVGDADTQRWMHALYGAHFRQRLDTAAAVRAAELEILRKRRARGMNTHPGTWGAFVAVGDWR